MLPFKTILISSRIFQYPIVFLPIMGNATFRGDNMSHEDKILKRAGEAVDMGRDSLKQALEKAHDESLKDVIRRQMTEYDREFAQVEALMQRRGQEPTSAPKIAKANSRIMVNMQTAMANDKDAKIAEMVIQGSTMGITKMTEVIHQSGGRDAEAETLVQHIIQTEQSNIDEMKRFL